MHYGTPHGNHKDNCADKENLMWTGPCLCHTVSKTVVWSSLARVGGLDNPRWQYESWLTVLWELTHRPSVIPCVRHCEGPALAVCDDFPMSALMWSLDCIVWYCPVCLTILQSECRCKVTRVWWGLYCVCVHCGSSFWDHSVSACIWKVKMSWFAEWFCMAI